MLQYSRIGPIFNVASDQESALFVMLQYSRIGPICNVTCVQEYLPGLSQSDEEKPQKTKKLLIRPRIVRRLFLENEAETVSAKKSLQLFLRKVLIFLLLYIFVLSPLALAVPLEDALLALDRREIPPQVDQIIEIVVYTESARLCVQAIMTWDELLHLGFTSAD